MDKSVGVDKSLDIINYSSINEFLDLIKCL